MKIFAAKTRVAMVALGLAVAVPALAQIVSQTVSFPRGASSTTINSAIRGDVTRDYIVRAGAGQTLNVTLRPTNSSTYFNVLPPNSQEALFIGSTSGNSYNGRLSQSGAYTVRVYLMCNAARRNEASAYRLTIGIGGGGQGGGGQGWGGGQRPGNGGGPQGGLGGLRGMSSIAAIDEMSARGFRNVDSFSSGDTLYGIYFNPRTRVCAQLTNANNRVVDASDIRTHPKCR